MPSPAVDEAIAAGEALGWDVVLKATAEHLRERPDLAHVWRNIDTPEEMRDAWDALTGLITDPDNAGFVVQRNAPPGVPVAIAQHRGPALRAGRVLRHLGAADRAARRPGLPDPAAHRRSTPPTMVREIKAAPLLFGYRGSEVGRRRRGRAAVRRVAQLQNDLPQVRSLELSLVLAGADGATVLTAAGPGRAGRGPALGLVRAPAARRLPGGHACPG